jgi:MerR HTH family regulatory protein
MLPFVQSTESTYASREYKVTDQPRKRGGATKQAPPGFYTAREAANKLGLNIYTFRRYVRAGKIQRYVPPLRKEGYYNKEEIDQIASATETFWQEAKKGQ